MFWNVLITSMAGGFICLDRIFLQAMISRPVVAGPVIGIILNDPATGLFCGALVELLWMDRLPVGTSIPPNDTVATVTIAAAAILAGREVGHHARELATFCILLFLPLGYASQHLDTLVVKSNDRISDQAISDAARGDIEAVSRKHLRGLLKSFAVAALLILVALYPGVYLVIFLFPLLPPFAVEALRLCYYFLPLLGVAVAMTTIKRQGAAALFGLAFVSVLLLMQWIHGWVK